MLPLYIKDINGLECRKVCRFPGIAPKYRIFHWIAFYSVYQTIAHLYSFHLYHVNGVIP